MSAVVDLSSPETVMRRLDEIDRDLAVRQNALEAAAMAWFRMKRNREKAKAEAFLTTEGTVAERQARADIATALHGREEEALFEALKAVVRTLETRANIGMAILKAQGRA